MTAKQKIQMLFWIIAFLSIIGTSLILGFAVEFLKNDIKQFILVSIFVIAPLFIQSLGAAGLARSWFDHRKLRSGKIINILQWVAGIFGVLGIFDFTMRFMRKSSWMFDSPVTLVVDGILVATFILWLTISYFIEESAEKNKTCEFC